MRAELEKKGTPIGAMNFQIAATALLYTATLVTNNVREFSKVEGLVWEAVGGVGRKNTPQGGGDVLVGFAVQLFLYVINTLDESAEHFFLVLDFLLCVLELVLQVFDFFSCFLELALQSG